MGKRKVLELALIVGMVLPITLMHYYTSHNRTEFHAFSALLYYIPIIFAAFRFGLKGGAITGAIVSLLYAPYLIWNREHLAPELTIKILDVLLYNCIGWITGMLVESEHNQKRKYLAAVEQLSQTNHALEQKIKEKSELEEQIRRSDKLAAMGVMVSGVAHELRNPLGILKATIQVMDAEIGNNPTVKEFTAVVHEEVDRMGKSIQEFLDFARPSTPRFEMVDIHPILQEVLQFTRKYLDQHQIEIHTYFATDLPSIYADEKQIRQVFINLMLNSVAAIEAKGTIEIVTENMGNYICVRFTDTGCGISKENLAKIFDPFYTTKDNGTGLGLAVSHRIIDSHKGFFEVDSEIGKGTEFRICLPTRC